MCPKKIGYLQLEQPLFLRMSSGVVPKTNLTFCSTPCGQRTHIACRMLGGGGRGSVGWGQTVYARQNTQCSKSLNELPFVSSAKSSVFYKEFSYQLTWVQRKWNLIPRREDIMTLSCVKELNVGVSKPQLQRSRHLSKEEAAAKSCDFNLLRPVTSP